jgi:kynurenine 3-monooxygenase
MKVAVIGAGLAGSMIAALLGQMDGSIEIILFEKRADPRNDHQHDHLGSPFGASISSIKRSINLALSYRGIIALKEVGLLDDVMKSAIPMPGRIIHDRNGHVTKQAYGKPNEAIYSVGRQDLNCKLLQLLEKLPNVSIKFHYSLVDVTANGHCQFTDKDGNLINYTFDLVVGADGAYSSTRESILRKGRINFSRSYISHGYKELSIPPKMSSSGQPEYALQEYGGLHIWPRGKFMMIALPNPDFSFTATLFAPYHDDDGFDMMEQKKQAGQIKEYFERHFPDLIEIMPDLEKDFHENPVGSLVTVRVKPWNLGKVALIGDAAHAVVPFFGQGMNAAFEDGYLLYSMLKPVLESQSYQVSKGVIESILEQFSCTRQPAVDCLADLCIEHYDDMALNTSSGIYLLKKRFDALVAALLSDQFIPLYSLVAFTNVPYHHAVARAKRQDKYISIITASLVTSAMGIAGFYLMRKSLRLF